MRKKQAEGRTGLNCERSATKRRRVQSKHKGPSNPRSVSWTKLPYLVLVEIYRDLSDTDKVAMAQVCHEWRNAFRCPVLWRTRQFILGGPNAVNAGKRAVQYAENLGSFLQEVSISCRHITSNTCNVITETLETFVKCLSNARLRRFEIEDLELDRFWKHAHLRSNVTNSLVAFFRGQHNLEVVTLDSAQITLLSGSEILEALLKSSGHSLRILDIMDFFQARLAAYQLSRFFLTMCGFSNLEKVTLNYCCVCNELLQYWAKSLQGKLTHLTIKAGEDEPHSHVLTNETWRSLTAACPKLAVEFAIFGIAHTNSIIPLLSPYIPLVAFTMWSGYDDDTDWQLGATLNHLHENYHERLQALDLNFDNFHNVVDDDIILTIARCQQLRTIRIKANASVRVASVICQLVKERQPQLQEVNLTLCDHAGPDIEQVRDQLRELQEEMDPIIEARGINLVLLDGLF